MKTEALVVVEPIDLMIGRPVEAWCDEGMQMVY